MNIFEYGNPSASRILVQMTGEHEIATLEKEVALVNENVVADFRLIAIQAEDWNRDLSPWKAPAVFGKEDFGDGAGETLKEVLNLCTDAGKAYYIGGYSLAGLFALWAAYQTERFIGVAAVSPSMWFPDFVPYMKANEIRSSCVYLSLGDREAKTRNPVMATVEKKIREAYTRLQEQGVETILEWNPGNHFKDAELRTARAFSWLLAKR